jgi:hypothetical protein
MWRFPRYLPNLNEVINPEDLEEALGPFRSAPGALGEHHWNAAIASELVRKDDVATDAVYRTANPQRTTTVADWMDDPLHASALLVKHQSGWTPIPDTEHTFQTEGGLFLVWASGAFRIAANTLTSNQLKFGILLNGAFYVDLGIGGFDELEEGVDMEQGYGGWRGGWDVDGVISLPPGTHTLQACVKSQTSPDIYVAWGTTQANFSIGMGELFVAEIIA